MGQWWMVQPDKIVTRTSKSLDDGGARASIRHSVAEAEAVIRPAADGFHVAEQGVDRVANRQFVRLTCADDDRLMGATDMSDTAKAG